MSDFYTDQGAFFVRLFNAHAGIPEFVKNANYSEDTSVSSLPSTSFADSLHRRFPLHTPADVYVSAAYYFGKTGELESPVARKLEKAAAIFGIADDFKSVRDYAVAYHERTAPKTAADASGDFTGWVIETQRMNASGNSLGQLERLADTFLSKTANYAFDEREEIACEILLASRSIGAQVNPGLKKYAAEGEFVPEVFAHAMAQRAFVLQGNDKLAFLDELKGLSLASEPTADDLRKAACFLDVFDRQYGLDRHYGRGVLDPHSSVWSKVADVAGPEMVKVGEAEYELDKVAGKLPAAFEYATGRILDLLENGKIDTGLLASLTGEQSSVVNNLIG